MGASGRSWALLGRFWEGLRWVLGGFGTGLGRVWAGFLQQASSRSSSKAVPYISSIARTFAGSHAFLCKISALILNWNASALGRYNVRRHIQLACIGLPCFVFLCLALPCLALLCLGLPGFTLPCLASPCLALLYSCAFRSIATQVLPLSWALFSLLWRIFSIFLRILSYLAFLSGFLGFLE